MIKALIHMALKMWKNRCDCLHGHTTEDKVRKKKEKIKDQVKKCFQQRREIPFQHQHFFWWDMSTLYKKRIVYYLTKWVETVEAIQLQTSREMATIGRVRHLAEESQSEATCSTGDLDEYLVDVNDGMDIEDAMANSGEVHEGQGIEEDYEIVVGCSQDQLEEEASLGDWQ